MRQAPATVRILQPPVLGTPRGLLPADGVPDQGCGGLIGVTAATWRPGRHHACRVHANLRLRSVAARAAARCSHRSYSERMTQSRSQLDAMIVGAVPTGLTLAAQLQLFGARFRIVDRLFDRTRESRALAVQARTIELLQMLGIGERLVARGNTSTRLKLHLEGRAVAAVTLRGCGPIPCASGQLYCIPLRRTYVRLTRAISRCVVPSGEVKRSMQARLPAPPREFHVPSRRRGYGSRVVDGST